MEKVLVTGGAGYIGSVLVGDLLADGYEVAVVDNFLYQENSLAIHYLNPNFHVYNQDVRNIHKLASILESADWVVPLAAIVGAPACNQDVIAAESTNVNAALELFSATRTDTRIVMPTTNSAYGTTPSGTVTTEDSELNPISSYALHKVKVEKALLERGNATSFRLATVFGMSPRMRLDLLVNDMVNKAIRDKSVVLFESHFVRNFIHVRDVSNAIRFAMNHWSEFQNEIFNVGLSSANISKRALCEKIQEYLPEFVFFESNSGKDPDQRNYWVSNEKIESKGFKCEIDLDKGIAELIKGIPNLNLGRYGNI